ncbi:hypothetical protein ACSVDE_06780 [Pseudalkalibacillus sp. Hm43]|uniref:hypothetical protein n=1 Tax=Pseudalkalibacillus sp. Hm43 TaxID=3450742 RepID=UPI003F432142
MEKELEKVRKRTEKRLEYHRRKGSASRPINSALDHLGRIEGYPTRNVGRINMKGLPKPIRIIGYIWIGFIGLMIITLIYVNIRDWL